MEFSRQCLRSAQAGSREMSQVWRGLKELRGLPRATPLDVSSPNGASHEVYSRAFPVGLFLRAASTSAGSGEQQRPAW